jgi:hypothetical protein
MAENLDPERIMGGTLVSRGCSGLIVGWIGERRTWYLVQDIRRNTHLVRSSNAVTVIPDVSLYSEAYHNERYGE